jgi:hypothetical protein
MNYTDIRQSIINIIAKGKPVIDISDLFFKHKCYYLLGLSSLTPEQKNKLDMILAINEINHKTNYLCLKNVFKIMANENYAIVKGAVFSKAAYFQPNMRTSLDIDLMIHPFQITHIKDIFLANGFTQGKIKEKKVVPNQRKETVFYTSNSHQLAPFVAPTGNKLCPFVNVDLNFSIIWGESKKPIDMDFVLSELKDEIIYGQAIKKLSPEMEFIHLCLHHYKDLNSIYLISKGNIKLSLFSDIFFFIIHTEFDIQKMLFISEKLNVSRYIYYCLFYCAEIFFHTKLDALILVYNFSADDNLINSYGLHESERKKWTFSFFDRLFLEDFPQKFIETLDDHEREKINTNYKFSANN